MVKNGEVASRAMKDTHSDFITWLISRLTLTVRTSFVFQPNRLILDLTRLAMRRPLPRQLLYRLSARLSSPRKVLRAHRQGYPPVSQPNRSIRDQKRLAMFRPLPKRLLCLPVLPTILQRITLLRRLPIRPRHSQPSFLPILPLCPKLRNRPLSKHLKRQSMCPPCHLLRVRRTSTVPILPPIYVAILLRKGKVARE